MRHQIDGIVGKDSVVKSWSRESFHIYLFHLFQIHKDTSDNIVSLIAIYLCMHHDTSLSSIMVQRFCRHLPCRKISGSKVSCYDCLWLGPKGYRSESWNPFALSKCWSLFPRVQLVIILTYVHIMDWFWTGDKPFSEPSMSWFITDAYIRQSHIKGACGHVLNCIGL